MDIKIGLTQSPRELVISTEESQEVVVTKVKEAISSDAGILELQDDKGSKFVVNVTQIAYVEVGTSAPRTVGFAGA
ncbi:DUF3107 domain-containing protein [Corynebacterium sp. A21]|uniref:DUF3107 domain-containing protein n=1 Tax=Corynebacterium sp. A21 TaxID=3457318 RepID=UPI003FD63275